MFAERLLGWRDEGSANWIIDGDAGLGLLPSPPHGVWMGLPFVSACLDWAELWRFLGSWSCQVLGLSWIIFLEEKSAQTHQAEPQFCLPGPGCVWASGTIGDLLLHWCWPAGCVTPFPTVVSSRNFLKPLYFLHEQQFWSSLRLGLGKVRSPLFPHVLP